MKRLAQRPTKSSRGPRPCFLFETEIRALLCLGRYRDTADLCDEIIRLSPYSHQSDFIFRGVAEWLDNRQEDAVAAWQRGSRAHYTDAAGGVKIPLLLLFAAIRRSESALRKLSEAAIRKFCKRRAIVNWPGTIAHFAAGKIDENELLAAMNEPAVLRERHSCEAEFYVATLRLARGDHDGYIEFLKRSCSHGPKSLLEAEFFLASGELRANPGAAPPKT